VREQRNDDAAFSLLVGAYHEVKLAQLRAAHEEMVKAVAAQRDPNAERQATERHLKECDARLAKLRTQLANLEKTYGFARAADSKAADVSASASTSENLPPAMEVEQFGSVVKKVTALAERWAAQGADFDGIFQKLCAAVLSEADANPQLTPRRQADALFDALWIWAREKNGRPVLQQRADWALHFIAGGMLEAGAGLGHSAAAVKERIDSGTPGNFFDLDDLAATMLGARWADLATVDDPAQARRWLQLWADGRYSLQRSLPQLRYGHLPPGQAAGNAQIDLIHVQMNVALALPAPPSLK
jgi:hypothetical protein